MQFFTDNVCVLTLVEVQWLNVLNCSFCVWSSDHQKLEREARICRLLKHSNIGESQQLACAQYTHAGGADSSSACNMPVLPSIIKNNSVCVCVSVHSETYCTNKLVTVNPRLFAWHEKGCG